MNITKKEILQKLHTIEERNKVKLDHEIQLVIRNKVIPLEVIKIINKYDNNFLKIYDTFNTIHKSRNKNPLYKNLVRDEINDDELAISISSFVTKVFISLSKIKDENDRIVFVKAMNIDNINTALSKYGVTGDSTELRECAMEIKNLFKLLYID